MLNKVRELKKESRGLKTAGFTIIEVMIVLAIAGLIMAIVFLAIPALQRNNRNTQRKSDVSRVAGQINDYISNNNGKLPTRVVFNGGTVVAGELDLTKESYSILDTGALTTNGAAYLKLTGDLTLVSPPPTGIANRPATATGNVTPPKEDTFFFYANANCGGTNIPKFTGSSRSFALWYGIEGSTLQQCLEG